MKKALGIVAMLMSTSAHAQYVQFPQRVIPIFEQDLQCTPPLDYHDRNPVKTIWVSFSYDRVLNQITTMNVNHEQWYGQFIDRFVQYPNSRLIFDGATYGWTGVYAREPWVTMAGGAFLAQDGRWYYRERQWKNGVPAYDMTSPCIPFVGE